MGDPHPSPARIPNAPGRLASKASQAPPDAREAWLRATGALVLHAHLAGRALPERLGDVPARMLVDRLARMDAKAVLATLQDVYGIERWDMESFDRAFIEGALGGWRPGSLVQHAPGKLRVVSTTCPIGAEAEKDPRICEVCQAFQKHTAYLALVGQVEDVRIPRRMSQGESACELRITFRPPARGPRN